MKGRADRDGAARTRSATGAAVGDRYPDWEADYHDNVTWVYRTIFARVGNRADAEDLTAEVFLAALKPLRITATVAEVRAYLRATARTVLAAHWRQTLGREITTIDDIAEVAPDAEEDISTAPGRVHGVLEGLPDNYRRILELRFLHGRSIKDSAKEMGISVANAKVLQHPLYAWRHRSAKGTAMNARGMRRYVDDLLARRRPKPFQPDDFEAEQIRTAIDLQAARMGADAPDQDFLSDLHSKLAAKMGEDQPDAEVRRLPSATRRQVVIGTSAAAATAVAAVAVDRLAVRGNDAGDTDTTAAGGELTPNEGSWQAVGKSADVNTDGDMHQFEVGS